MAAGSLVIQGLTLPWVVRVVRPSMEGPADEEERGALVRLLITTAKEVIAERDDAGPDGADRPEAGTPSAVIEHDDGNPAEPSGPATAPGASQQAAGTVVGVVPRSTSDLTTHIVRKDNGDYVVSAALAAEAWRDPEVRRREIAAARATTLDMIRAQREALLDAGELGLYSAGSIEYALTRLDYEEIMLTSQPR